MSGFWDVAPRDLIRWVGGWVGVKGLGWSECECVRALGGRRRAHPSLTPPPPPTPHPVMAPSPPSMFSDHELELLVSPPPHPDTHTPFSCLPSLPPPPPQHVLRPRAGAPHLRAARDRRGGPARPHRVLWWVASLSFARSAARSLSLVCWAAARGRTHTHSVHPPPPPPPPPPTRRLHCRLHRHPVVLGGGARDGAAGPGPARAVCDGWVAAAFKCVVCTCACIWGGGCCEMARQDLALLLLFVTGGRLVWGCVFTYGECECVCVLGVR